MTIKELYYHWYESNNRGDIHFCCLCSALLELIDVDNGEDVRMYLDLSDDISDALGDLLDDYK